MPQPLLHFWSRLRSLTSAVLFDQSMDWQQTRLRVALAYCAVFACSYVLASLLIVRFYHQQVDTLMTEYGSTLVRQMALNTVDSVVRGDRISLHAQLEGLAAIAPITDAAVYDIENHILAQTERNDNAHTASRESSLKFFTATIGFEDAIAGKVIVSMDPYTFLNQQHWLYGALACSLLLCAVLTLGLTHLLAQVFLRQYQRLVTQIYQIEPKILGDIAADSTGAAPTLSLLETNLSHLREYVNRLEHGAPVVRIAQTETARQSPAGSYAELLINCANLQLLQQQVHHRELQRKLDDLQRHIQSVRVLYRATDVHFPGSHIILRFNHDDVTDAAMQAICAAVVLRQLFCEARSLNPIPLEFRFVVHWHEHDRRPLSSLTQNYLLLQELHDLEKLCCHAKPDDILVTRDIKQSSTVAEHIKLELISGDSDVDFYRVQRLSDAYRKLLEQQALQLAEAAASPSGH